MRGASWRSRRSSAGRDGGLFVTDDISDEPRMVSRVPSRENRAFGRVHGRRPREKSRRTRCFLHRKVARAGSRTRDRVEPGQLRLGRRIGRQPGPPAAGDNRGSGRRYRGPRRSPTMVRLRARQLLGCLRRGRFALIAIALVLLWHGGSRTGRADCSCPSFTSAPRRMRSSDTAAGWLSTWLPPTPSCGTARGCS
jgi:hypothetical protein